MSTRVLVIGLDACEKDILLDGVARGELPALASLMRDATWGIVEPPAGVYAGAAWPSFSTGTDPAHHRRFFCRQTPRGEYLDADFPSAAIEGAAFWDVLSDAGHRVAVIDVPHFKLSSSLNGIQVVDWTTHAPETAATRTLPASLHDDLVSRFGKYEADRCESVRYSASEILSLFAELEARLRAKAAMSRHYLDSAEWDLFVTVVGEGHCAGHQWWHLHDPTHPAHDSALRAEVGDLVEATYAEVDRAVGQIAAGAAADTRVIVLSSHGMGPRYGESVALDEVLRRLEPPRRSTGSLFSGAKRLWYALPANWRSATAFDRLRRIAQQPIQESLLVRDRRTRRYFAVPTNPHAGAIRVNLAGRETHGVVAPGSEYRAVCDFLRCELMELRCPISGAAVVADVLVTADVYTGPFADELPDLLIEWRRSGPIRGLASARVGNVPIPTVHGRSGDHCRDGLFIGHGPGITEKRIARSVPITDFAPTIAAWLDTALPPAFAGTAIPELNPHFS